MTTPAIHVPTTAPTYERMRTPLLVAIAVAAVFAAALTIGLPGDAPAPSTSADAVREWTRAEVIDHLTRVNGLAGSGAAASTSSSVGTSADTSQDATLQELYRINGVFPAEPVVPATAR